MEQIINTPIIEEVEQSFLDYSVSVITDRAIPSVEDGLKPVARRILWDMYDQGYTNNKKVVKCSSYCTGGTLLHSYTSHRGCFFLVFHLFRNHNQSASHTG